MSDLSYKFTASATPAVALLQADIAKMTSSYYEEKDLIALISNASKQARAGFYETYQLGVQHFMIDRRVLDAGSDDNIASLIKRHPSHIMNPRASDIISIPLRRGLIKALDIMYAVIPPDKHGQLTSSLGIFLSPNHQGDPSPNNEAGQNYLRALDYMIAKGFDINGREWYWQPQIITCALYPSLLPEIEKRGGDLDKAIERERQSMFTDRGASQQLYALESYKSAKTRGILAHTGNNWQDIRAHGEILQETWREMETIFQGSNSEDDMIALIQKNPPSLTDFKALTPDIISRGMARAFDTMIQKCDDPHKARVAALCLEMIGRCFSPADNIDKVHDQGVLTCLDVAIRHGAMNNGSISSGSSAMMIVMTAEKGRRDIVHALVARGADLKRAKHLAANAYSCDEGGGNQQDLYPTAKKLLGAYRYRRMTTPHP